MRHPKGLVNGYHRRKIAPVDEPVITARGLALVDPFSVAQYAILESMTVGTPKVVTSEVISSTVHKIRDIAAA